MGRVSPGLNGLVTSGAVTGAWPAGRRVVALVAWEEPQVDSGAVTATCCAVDTLVSIFATDRSIN